MKSKRFKKVLYGVIPYYFTKLFNPKSPNIESYKYIIEHRYSRHLFHHRHEYDGITVDIHWDEQLNLPYVIHKNNRRLYFHRNLKTEKIKRMYRELLMEQDCRSAHHYFDDISEVRGKVFLDVGSAEGQSSLDVIEEAEKIYLFERDEQWIEALTATFKPWEDKVTIVRKFVSDCNDNENQTLDDFFKDKPKENIFLKMDIEGAERKALQGSKNLFREAKNLKFAICTYHKDDDEQVISDFLNKHNCSYSNQKAYFNHRLRSMVLRGEIPTI